MKFSIIVPAFGVEKYLDKCLKSIFNQSYKDFEVIVNLDGSLDNGYEIASKYDVIIINDKNKGLSMARNDSIKLVSGDYIIFLDGDDYIDKDLLKNINKNLNEKAVDIVRFQIREVFEDGKSKDYKENGFINKEPVDAFNEISTYHFVENAWAYAFNSDFYRRNKFVFMKGKYHEDFGLIPYVLMKSGSTSSISYVGYNYLQRTGSIMSNKNYEKTLNMVDDFYVQFKSLRDKKFGKDIDRRVYDSFISNSVILKITELKYEDYKKYFKKLKEENVFDLLLDDTRIRKIKKKMLKVSPRLYYKFIK